jgi:hypothetical protein
VVGVTGNVVQVLRENQRGIGDDEVDTIFQNLSLPRQIASGKTADYGAAAEGVSELAVQAIEQLLIRRPGQVRQIHLDSCLFG